ncbi:MAG: carbohydrate ABC transporter substrate-binding protein, partial [Clostridia bacterium]|nr:carbohydrate ABC transporter substrate-binding protein [Clostridia bacterium]
NTTEKSSTATTGKSSQTIATNRPVTKPSDAPTIVSTTTKNEIVLPDFAIDSTRGIKICIDWDPASAWVQIWEKAFRLCYDPDKEITVTYVQATPSMKAAKLAVWSASKQMPDAIYIKPEESWPTLINKNFALPVDDLVDLDAGFWEGVKETMEGLEINGKNYVLVSSAYSNSYVIYHAKTMKNAGLTDPRDLFYDGEWTFAKFEEYARKLTKANSTDPTKSSYGVFFHYYNPFLFGGGVDLISYKDGKWISNLNSKAITTSVEYLRRLGDTGNKYTYTDHSDITAVRSMVMSGQLGMYVTAEVPGFEFTGDAYTNAFDTDVLRYVPVPHHTEVSDTYYVPGTVDGWLVLKGGKHNAGGAAYAASVRAIQVMNLKVYEDGEASNNDAQAYFNSYSATKVVPVPCMFNRLSAQINALEIYGPTVQRGESWSAAVAEWEPKILEALAKE